MDSEEARRVLFRRVQSLDGENSLKIMGYLLLQGWGEQDMLHLAISSDYALESLVAKAQLDLGLTPPLKSAVSCLDMNNNPSLSYLFQQTPTFSPTSPLDLHDFNSYSAEIAKLTEESSGNPYSSPSCIFPQINQHYHHHQPLQTPTQPLNLQQHLNPTCFNDPTWLQRPNLSTASFLSHGQQQQYFHNLNLQIDNQNPNNGLLALSNKWSFPINSPRDSTNNGFSSTAYSAIPSSHKPCLYFARGYCKHGNNCRFSHNISRDTLSSSPPLLDESLNGTSPLSLESLEMELKELLRGRKCPVSIASLPQLYFEKYGKTLQAEGYLTESQRHGKAGFSLTKLLSKLKSTVMVIDRPHGQHAIMLIEGETNDGTFNEVFQGMNANSRQIYLTFPAESTFSEEDVIIHFRAYGPVQDVRIPFQQKRMFGFVTFMYSETVRAILVEGNPHYICGARVLVKPYKEKAKLNDNKKLLEREGNAIQLNSFRNSYDQFSSQYLPFSTGFKYEECDEASVSAIVNGDAQILSLERKMQEMNLDWNNNNEEDGIKKDLSVSSAEASTLSSFSSQQSEEDELNLTLPDSAEDCFHLQANMFRYVLDVLESDGKDQNDFPELSEKQNPIGSLDLNLLDDPFNQASDSVLKKSTKDFPKEQKPSATAYNWSEPTLFSWSVY